jgi:hypothetical protein
VELDVNLPAAEVVITENNNVAKLARTEPKKQWPCKAGSAKKTLHRMAWDFDAPLNEFKEYISSQWMRFSIGTVFLVCGK